MLFRKAYETAHVYSARMTFLPIVARELRVASRRRATYWSRSVTALLGIVIGVIIFMQFHDEPPLALGQSLFVVISVLAFLYCLVVGVRSTADCLSEERREGTLGLLFLTDLKGYDVVGGKLVATSLNAFYGLIAIVPLLLRKAAAGGRHYERGILAHGAGAGEGIFCFRWRRGCLFRQSASLPAKRLPGRL